jgi:holo-[acyl-carrier protein] synthase
MILGIGVDSVEIKRFATWSLYPKKILLRIFSEQEITYCLQTPAKTAERFAVRFAAREAFFKALSMYQPEHTVPFLTLCRLVTIEKNKNNAPILIIDWEQIASYQPIRPAETLISFTHTEQIATAFVILQETRA